MTAEEIKEFIKKNELLIKEFCDGIMSRSYFYKIMNGTTKKISLKTQGKIERRMREIEAQKNGESK